MANMIDEDQMIGFKLDYLKELRELLKVDVFNESGLTAIATRHARVCESIENDLGINKSSETLSPPLSL